MAQLVKLQDYISRYETDMYRYPGQFIRLKKENWKKVKYLWENGQYNIFNGGEDATNDTQIPFSNEEFPTSEQALKQYFLDKLLPFQLKWASSTMKEISFLDKIYAEDNTLRYFLQRFPDTSLFMYNPIFQLKNAPIQTDHIIIHPLSIYCITIVEKNPTNKIIAGGERTWYLEDDNIRQRMLSPLLSLKRSYRVIRNILSFYNVDFPVKQIVLSRYNTIEFEMEPYQTEYIGREQYNQWFQHIRQMNSPLKYQQLKVSELLLKHSQSTSVKRPEWDREEEDFM